ncbi:AraC family transcriptional regulator [Roseateles sp. LYH14W]|uniref:AraC family transcriptional regulator n=1 Tax=Pelomonas parva TaxID=3299032 RepID=A0ABW7FC67_9BURK
MPTLPAQPVDPFDDALADLRIVGTVLLHCAYAPPWAVDVPAEPELRGLIQAPPHARVLVFHHVRAEAFELRLGGAPPLDVGLRDIALVTDGAAHRLSRGDCHTAVPLASILAGMGPPPTPRGTAGATELICGVFVTQGVPLNPLLGALPPVLRVTAADDSATPMLAGTVALLAQELDRGASTGFSAARLLELMCAETLKVHRDSAGATIEPGWLRGLADARLGAALRCVHERPQEAWSVERLAGKVALSPSRFAARFRAGVGMSVMGYVAQWRANVACRLLIEGQLPLAEVAARVGYDSVPAFSRAFKGQLGQPPGAWRLARR